MVDRSKAPEVKLMGDLELPVPKEELLPNGIRLYSLDGSTQPVTQLMIMWQGGAIETPVCSAGHRSPSISRIACALMREGTAALSGAEISEIVDFNGAMLHITPDAHYTTLYLTSLNSMIENVLPVVRDIVCSPSMPEATFERLRENTVHEHALNMAKVNYRSNQELMRLLKGANHLDVCDDSAAMIREITLDDVRAYYAGIVTAAGCRAYLSGCITDTVYRLVREMLESLPVNGSAMPLSIEKYSPQPPQRVTLEMGDKLQASVSMGIPEPSRESSDYVALRFAVMGLGGYFGSRLMKNIREDKGFTYGINSYLMGSQEGSNVVIEAQADPNYIDALLGEVEQELTAMAIIPFGADELQRLRQHLALSLMGSLDSPLSVMSYYRTMHSVGMPSDYFRRQVDGLRALNAEEICRISDVYLRPENLRVAVAK